MSGFFSDKELKACRVSRRELNALNVTTAEEIAIKRAGFSPEVVGGGAIQWTRSLKTGDYSLVCTEDGGIGGDPLSPIWIGEVSDTEGHEPKQLDKVPLAEAIGFIWLVEQTGPVAARVAQRPEADTQSTSPSKRQKTNSAPSPDVSF